MKLPGEPHSKRGMNVLAIRELWRLRKRMGRGGGWEYGVDDLPERIRTKIIRKKPGLLTGNEEGSECAASDNSINPPESNHEELWRLYSQRPGRQKKVAEDRLKAVNRVFDLENAGLKNVEAVGLVSNEISVSPGTIYNWIGMIRGVNKHDWLPALLGKWRGCVVKTEYSDEAWDFFKGDYLRLEAPAAAACYDRLKRTASKENWTIPSLTILIRRLRREMPRTAIVLAREGKKSLDLMFPSQRRDKSCLEALECVDADGHKFDVFCRWPDGTIARPVGLFYHDVFSGKFLSYRVDRTENKDLIRLALADLAERFGIPREIYLDNSRSFASKWLTGGVKNRYRFKVKSEEPTGILTNLGSEIHWTKPYRGQSKPIERRFRDLAESVSKHPALAGAYTGKNPTAKPENYGSKAIDIDVFLKVLAQEITADGAREGRRSPVCNGRSFDSVFSESYQHAVIRKVTKEQRGLLLLAAEGVKASRYDGSITVDRNRYWNEKLSQYGGKRLIVRLDPQNLHAGAFIYNLDNSFICDAECILDAGFNDKRAAREDARLKHNNIKATKRILENNRRRTALQVAAMMPEGKGPETVSPTSKVMEGLFAEKITARRKEKEEDDRRFVAAMEAIGQGDLKKINKKYAVN